MAHKPRIAPNFQDIIERYKAGETIRSLADECGKSISTLKSHFAMFGVEILPAYKTTVPIQEILEAHARGDSVKSIAERLGVARNVVQRRINDSGFTTRTRSEAMLNRWQNISEVAKAKHAQRLKMLMKGRKPSMDRMCKAAATRQARGSTRSSVFEAFFAEMLQNAGLDFIPQFAVGPYSCDFMVGGIAVEIFGGEWHRHGDHAARSQKRSHYILDSGFHLYCIWCSSKEPITIQALNDFLAFRDLSSSNPPAVRQYRVVRGAGDLVASGCANDDHIAGVGSFKAA